MLLHWLGEAFDPALRGYWGSEDFGAAADTVIELIERADGKVAGIKLSVLDAGHERSRCGAGCRPASALYTGDDFHYAELIRGDATATATRCSARSRRSPPQPPPPCTRWTRATWPATTRRWARPWRSAG